MAEGPRDDLGLGHVELGADRAIGAQRPRRRGDGSDPVPILDVDGDIGPRTRFATKTALAGVGLARLLDPFGCRG